MKDSQAGIVLRGGRKVLMEGNCCLRTRGIYVYGGAIVQCIVYSILPVEKFLELLLAQERVPGTSE